MNIFYLDSNPKLCAQYHCDKHVIKMILEYAQLMSTAHFVLDGIQVGYKPTHKNHPSAVWVRQAINHYDWLFDMFEWLCIQYTLRYGKYHKTSTLINLLRRTPANIPLIGWIEAPPQCMPDEYKNADTVTAYRNYYMGGKKDIAKWKDSNVPSWFN